MPLVTLTVRKPKPVEFKAAVLDAVHAALVSSGVPAADRFQRVLELSEADFRFDQGFRISAAHVTPTFCSSRSSGR